MALNLYEINEEILKCVDMETGEVIDEEQLNSLQMEFDQKAEGIALWVKDLLAEAEAIKAEKQALQKRQTVCENKAKSLKSYLSSALAGQKFSTPRVAISFRKSEQTEITDITKIDDDYLVYDDPKPNKAKIKKALKDGIKIEGAKIVETKSIQIK